jgi:Spy/CpxP family protein refolding chaperone
MTRRFLAAAALFAIAAIAQAQPMGMPPGKWWQRPEIVQELQLTSDQQQRLDAVFRNTADDLIDTKASIEKLQLAVRGELDRPQIRRAELQKIVTQLNAARGRMFELELMMLVDMRAVLNETQWVKVRQHLDRAHEQRDRRPPPPRGRRP